MAENLDRELRQLKQAIVEVGALAEDSLAKAVYALTTRDERLAREVIYADREIDRREVAVEEDCLKILALYQPVALDLRFVVAVIKINNDVEHIGDLAASIAKRVVYLARVMEAAIPVEFREMAALVQTMVKHSLDALVNAERRAGPPGAGGRRLRRRPARPDRRRDQCAHRRTSRADGMVHETQLHLTPPRAPGRHGRLHRRGGDLHGRRLDRSPPGRGLTWAGA